MVEIKIPFKDFFRHAMLSGKKTWTSRTKKYGQPGDTFKAFGATFRVLNIEKKPLVYVAEYFDLEGCKSLGEFIRVWRSLHPRKGFDPDQEVFVHIFTKLESQLP